VIRIVSGGQTGADRAALDVALKLGLECGGWCPDDRAAENGPIPDRYPLTPLPTGGYRQRTRQNVIDSDATVILCYGPLKGGSRATREDCIKLDRPHLVIDADSTSIDNAAASIRALIAEHSVQTLNVAGPRASQQPQIYRFVTGVLIAALTGHE